MPNQKDIAKRIFEKKKVSEVFTTSDGLFFTKKAFAEKWARKHKPMLKIEKIVKPKRSKK